MNLHQLIFTENDCYKSGRKIVPEGVMVHSTGANNPNLKRYVGPDDGLLGHNRNENHWNRPNLKKCVHAFIGRLEDGTIATYQTLPWEHRAWHCGDDANSTHISFEICEDDLRDPVYFALVYREAVELTAYLCEMYGLDPLEDGVAICHHEGFERGIASGHEDVDHWFPLFGKTMDDFRKDVAQEMEDDMTQEKFNEMMDVYLKNLAELEPSFWSQESRDWAEGCGLIKGDENGHMQYKSFCTREQMVTFLERLYNMVK